MKVFLRVAAVALVVSTAVAVFFYRDPLWFSDQQIRYHLWRAQVRSEFVQAGPYRLHYLEALPPDGSLGRPLLLLHGLGSRGEDWSPLIPTLAAHGFHVYAPDLLGFGRSPRPNLSYSISLEEQVVVDFMNAVQLSSADVDGWSMGGWIAAKLAIDHPARVTRLVLDDAAGLNFATGFPRDAFVPATPLALTRLLALLSPHPPSLRPFIERAALRRSRQQGWVVQRAIDSMESGVDLLDGKLSGISQPTLILWGERDALIPISVGEAMHQDIRNSLLVGIPGCGHLAPAECSHAVLIQTLAFLSPPGPGAAVQRDLAP